MQRRPWRLMWITLLALTLVVTACGQAVDEGSDQAAPQQSRYPERPIELVAAGDPGGGLDLLARAIEEALTKEKLLPVTLTIKNMGGGGGNPARAYLYEKRGDGYTLLTESNRIYLNPIIGTTDLDVDDFTPVARLVTDWVVLAVRADSPYQSVQDVVNTLKANPKAITFGVGTVPSNDQMNILRMAQAAGIDPAQINIVSFRSGGDLMTQLLGGHVAVISTGLSETLPQYQSGQVRILAISSPERVEGVDAPTWKELGYDIEIAHWRGVFAPPDMPADALAFWNETFAKMVQTPTWKQILERHGWYDAYLDSEAFKQSLQEEAAAAEELLKAVGQVK
ncbi:tripartite tricarboxylate transporter substrate binding protein [Thermaerobacter sp. FW80]|uniref:tripartite tricarboxylate transporter substrate binding protein n=1 Tax=Thermaerobacter sp. FW80 TaxID=2546351 RepID=UPI001074F2DF|nr:tripartite tricarboxylate transporter substrate binding protein [Thermaerobacter sp. FW80]QBS36685.1 tripartite tricarboxylate transporter substrate binding protein [Thermaerobacter sp. FW80]